MYQKARCKCYYTRSRGVSKVKVKTTLSRIIYPGVKRDISWGRGFRHLRLNRNDLPSSPFNRHKAPVQSDQHLQTPDRGEITAGQEGGRISVRPGARSIKNDGKAIAEKGKGQALETLKIKGHQKGEAVEPDLKKGERGGRSRRDGQTFREIKPNGGAIAPRDDLSQQQKKERD